MEAVLLKYGVLGLLIERRDYGYQLVQRLSERLGAAWQLSPSAVYGALDQLEDAELIAAVQAGGEEPAPERRSRRAARVVYEATEPGIGEFQAWLARPSVRASPIRSEIQLKVALAGPDNIPPLLASIAQEEWMVAQCLREECRPAGLAAGQRPSVAALAEDRPEGGQPSAPTWPSVATALVSVAAVTRLQGELAWIEVVRETLQRMSREQVDAAGRLGGPGTATFP
jgi:DNA-binding PadR family transcriptional regulator